MIDRGSWVDETELGESRFCGSCHLWYRAIDGGKELPVFTEYAEWQTSPQAEAGLQRSDSGGLGGGIHPAL